MSSTLFFDENDEDFPSDEVSCRKAFEFYLRQSYFKVMEIDGIVVGWLLACDGAGNYHSPIKALTQLYYHTTLRGTKAVKALIEFHEHLFNWAEQRRYEIVLTSSVISSSSETFKRILEKNNWRWTGRMLTRRTKWHSSKAKTVAGHGDACGRREASSTSETRQNAIKDYATQKS